MTSKNDKTIYKVFKKKFKDAGYDMPNCVYWDVSESSHSTHQAKSETYGVQMYSGQAISTFKTIMMNLDKTPYQAMVDTLNNEIFDKVVI